MEREEGYSDIQIGNESPHTNEVEVYSEVECNNTQEENENFEEEKYEYKGNNDWEKSEIMDEESKNIDWEEFDQLDYTTKKMDETSISQSDEDKDEEKAQLNEKGVNISFDQKLSELSSNTFISSKISSEIHKNSQKIIKRKLKSALIKETELMALGHNAQNKVKYMNICNFKWIDLEDPEVIMQEFYGQYEEESELFTIEEISMEMEETSEIISHRTSLAHVNKLKHNESWDEQIKDYLKYFPSDNQEFQLTWCVLSDETFFWYEKVIVNHQLLSLFYLIITV